MFDIGQKVVCINDSFPPGINDIFGELPRKGTIYQVRDVVPGLQFDLSETCAILLHEIKSNPNQAGIEPGFKWDRFRELDELREEEVERNLAELTALMEEYPELCDPLPLCVKLKNQTKE